MMATIFKLWSEEDGHDIAEYALIILVILVFLWRRDLVDRSMSSTKKGCQEKSSTSTGGWPVKRSQSSPCLHRQCETLRGMLTKSTMHDWTIQVSRHSHA
jgi:hypothetical protein